MSNLNRDNYASEGYYKFSHFARNWVATSGVIDFCEENKCHWALDVVASYIPTINRMKDVDYLLTINVKLNKTGSGAKFSITQEAAEGERIVLIKQSIPYTDLEQDLKFWAINSSPDNFDSSFQTVIMLPEEY